MCHSHGMGFGNIPPQPHQCMTLPRLKHSHTLSQTPLHFLPILVHPSQDMGFDNTFIRELPGDSDKSNGTRQVGLHMVMTQCTS